jgi:hypothetical protein
MLRTNSTVPKTTIVVILGTFFGFYAAIDAAAGYDRQTHILQVETEVTVVLRTEIALIGLHVIYVAISVVYLIVAVIQNDGINTRRLCFFALAVIATDVITIVTQVIFVLLDKFMYTAFGSILFCSIHITVASMSIFLLHSGGSSEYIEMPKYDAVDPMVLDPDQETDNGD